MSARTETPSTNPRSQAASLTSPRKPYFSLAIATAGGAGYIPFAPGTWGSVVGVVLYVLGHFDFAVYGSTRTIHAPRALPASVITIAIALAGWWAADRAARYLRTSDPQCIVVDEVSGQFLAYVAALAPVNWKYLLLGFILFRAFDIWKPFPARQAESLPGGLGIMADDWMAGIYAAAGLWIARLAGL